MADGSRRLSALAQRKVPRSLQVVESRRQAMKLSILVLLALVAAMAAPQSPATFEATGRMTTPRTQHTATLLQDGGVLIAGGIAEFRPIATLAGAELYDNGRFTATGSMVTPRAQHTATLLSDGKVLVAGGVSITAPSSYKDEASAELYDPSTGTFRQGFWRYCGGRVGAID